MDPATKSVHANAALQGKLAHLWGEMTDCCLGGHPASLIRARGAVPSHDGSRRQTQYDYVGYCERRIMEELIYPGSYRRQPRLNPNGQRTVRRGPGPGKKYFPSGQDWQELVVIPHFVKPDQFCGFAISCDATIPHPRPIFRAIPGTGYPRSEAGLGMLSSLETASAVFGDVVFATLQTLPAIYLQYRWLRQTYTHKGTLPLVTCVQTPYYASKLGWKNLIPKEVILFDEKYSLNLFKQARIANARIAIQPKLFEELNSPFRGIEGILKDLQQKSRPWQQLLDVLVYRSCDAPLQQRTELAKFLVDVGLTREEYADLLWSTRRGRQAFEGLAALTAFKPIFKKLSTTIDTSVPVTAQRLLWPADPQVRCIDLFIEQKLLSVRKKAFWRATLTDLAGVSFPFLVPAQEVKSTGLLPATSAAAQEKGQQLLLPPEATWRKYDRVLKSRYISVTQDADQVGFLKRTAKSPWEFRLPQFGVREKELSAKYRSPLVLPDTPAQQLRPPLSLSPEFLAPWLTISSRNALFWAAQLLVQQQIFAPIEERQGWGVAITGDGAESFLASLGRILDTTTLVVPKPRSWDFQIQRLNKLTSTYQWPVCVSGDERAPETIRRYLLEGKSGNVFISIPESCYYQALAANWAALTLPDNIQIDVDWETAFRSVLLNCLANYTTHYGPTFHKRRRRPWLVRSTDILSVTLKRWCRVRSILATSLRLISTPPT